uniref:Uncharacterized protein n=1 Tax=Oryza sativa subsp. japonica TaxID=39947 RepID=Q6K7I2_ORYSJ|nr:hypothetical protein [Oryza sativa Japonica Group]
MAALGYTALGLYRRREAKARVATDSGDTGDPFTGARRRRRRPTATGDAMEGLGFGRERRIRFEIESGDFQRKLDDTSKREKIEGIPRIISPLLI